ncbi:hypothetical protein [Shouchella shacheensis]|uniref:hypothetical protein n=1 Tax=Shouchella shacheensis TaxID=1649580 RepID=UPI00073FE0AF|nr:hypothetical protein [Shouchella shacheensis]
MLSNEEYSKETLVRLYEMLDQIGDEGDYLHFNLFEPFLAMASSSLLVKEDEEEFVERLEEVTRKFSKMQEEEELRSKNG